MKRKSLGELKACLALIDSHLDTLGVLFKRQRDLEMDSEDSEYSNRYWRLQAQRNAYARLLSKLQTEIDRREREKAAV